MKKVLVNAYLNTNFGDDLFVYMLCKKYEHVDFVIVSKRILTLDKLGLDNLTILTLSGEEPIGNTNKYFRKFTNLNEDYNYDLLLGQIDATIYIGGSLFIESPTYKVNYDRLMKGINLGIPNYVLGINFGPYASSEFYNDYYDYFAKSNDVCFREAKTSCLFSNELNNIRTTTDLAFSLDFPSNNKPERAVAISVIETSSRGEMSKISEEYRDYIVKVIKYYTKKKYKVSLVSFCTNEGDMREITRILKLLPKNIKCEVFSHTDVLETLNFLNNQKVIIGTRLHSILVGAVLGKKILPISYSPKTTNILKEINYSGPIVDIYNLKNAKYKYYSAKKIKLSNSIVEKSTSSFEELDSFFNK